MSEGRVGGEGEGQKQGEERERERERERGRSRTRRGRGRGRGAIEMRRGTAFASPAGERERDREREGEGEGERERARDFGRARPSFAFGTTPSPLFLALLNVLVSICPPSEHLSLIYIPCPPAKAYGEATMGIFHGHYIAASPLPHYHLPPQPHHTHCLLP